eukprot:413612_1
MGLQFVYLTLVTLFLYCMVGTVMKAEEHCNTESCQQDEQTINNLESVIIRVLGNRGNEIISQVKASPEDYLNDERPIIVELANALMNDIFSKLTVKDLYKEIMELKNQVQSQTQLINELNEWRSNKIQSDLKLYNDLKNALNKVELKQSKFTNMAPDDWPCVIQCNVNGWGLSYFFIVHYLHPHQSGTVYYRLIASGADYNFRYHHDGRYYTKDNVPSSDCDDKTTKQLYNEGKALNFVLEK